MKYKVTITTETQDKNGNTAHQQTDTQIFTMRNYYKLMELWNWLKKK